METIYYSLDAKRLTVCGEAAGRRASGGQETVCYAFVPRPRRPVTPAGGKVVDFTAYRQAAHPEEYAPREEAPGRPRPVRRRRTLALTVDLAATGAVVVLLAAVALFRGIEPKNCPGAALRTGAILCRGKNMQKTIDKLS